MKAFYKIIAGAAFMAIAAVSAPKAAAQVSDPVMIGSNIEYNIGLGFGVNFPMGIDENYYDPMNKAWGFDFSFNFAEFYWSGLSQTEQFFLTLGIENKSFRMRDDWGYGMVPVTETLAMVPYADMKMSALRIFSWNAGMGYRHVFDDNFDIMVGPIVNFNTSSRMKTKYYDADHKLQKEKIKGWNHHELVTIEAMIRLNISGIGLYVKYNPFPLIEEAYGPVFTTWSAGIML